MSEYKIRIFTKGNELPQLHCDNFFHSTELFHIVEKSQGQRPFMAVAVTESGDVVAHMLAFIRYRKTWLPPFVYSQGRIYGEGEYDDDTDKELLFSLMLHEILSRW